MIQSDSVQDIEKIREWYITVRNSLELNKREIYKSIRTDNDVLIPTEFIGMTENEFKQKFDEFFKELSYTVCLNLAACIEGNIQKDFKLRVQQRKKDIISKELKEIKNKEGTFQISLQDILNVWKEHKPELKKAINQYESVLKFRHWLAHGRHWTLKAKMYEEDLVYSHGIDILKGMEIMV